MGVGGNPRDPRGAGGAGVELTPDAAEIGGSDGEDRVADAFGEADEVFPDPSDAELAREWQSDLGNARRLVARHEKDLRWVRELGWIVWDGRRWVRSDGEALRRAHQVASAMIDEALAMQRAGRKPHEDEAAFEQRWKAHYAWAVGSSNHGRAMAMIASAAPYLALERERLDQDAWRLNVGNGTLHLGPAVDGRVAVRCFSHRRSDYATLCAEVDFDPAADGAAWTAFMGQVLPCPDTRRVVQKWLGYCLTGDISEQCVAILEGRGANGKSTMVDAVARLLGDYAQTVPIETFLHQDRRSGSAPTPDLARLPGARLVRTSEPEPGARLSESIIKQFTGGERLAARHLHRDMFEFRPAGKLVMSVNIRPTIVGKDHGIRRRIRVIPFRQQFPRTPGLTEALLAQRSGILNWLLDGYRLWREEGLGSSQEIEAATRAYFEEMDPIGSFVAEACEVRADLAEYTDRLWQAYRRWCDQSSEDAKSQTAFGRRLADMGFGKQKSSGVIKRVGLRVRDEWARGEASGPAAAAD